MWINTARHYLVNRPAVNILLRNLACWTTCMQGGVEPSQPRQDLATETVWTCEVFHRFQRGLKFLRSQLAGNEKSAQAHCAQYCYYRFQITQITHGSTNFPLFYYTPYWAKAQRDSSLNALKEKMHLYSRSNELRGNLVQTCALQHWKAK